ncbi:hypothetical protein EZV77_16015 [Burkholderia thailandensis]|uniref:Uncharacterized protein n=1 Tax=Burkholderia thailandensis TaxID=57975 RepID=A0AAW9CNC3_BURTH|nr:hypothetical protein A8H32_30695 [Burkholderia thailandensis]MDD1483828.1 hypothetical protein [Burkholderia thailandensis]MDD1490028.1 hypothetical protein [Burkholderia thailandensis]MDD1495955.1 hypothetical protein [Burkholderia thailandensis]MDW9237392.1 hypothetical protein [Burkholderia thailandensis]
MATADEILDELIDCLRQNRRLFEPTVTMPRAMRQDERRFLQDGAWRGMHRALASFDRRALQKEKPAAI